MEEQKKKILGNVLVHIAHKGRAEKTQERRKRERHIGRWGNRNPISQSQPRNLRPINYETV